MADMSEFNPELITPENASEQITLRDYKRDNPRLFDGVIDALAHPDIKNWPLKTRDDVLAALDKQLLLSPPRANILQDLITAETKHLEEKGDALPKGFVEQLKIAMAYPLTFDNSVGMLPKESSDFFFDLCSYYKQTYPTRDVGVVEVDISNMGNANEVLGRGNVTTSVAVMNRIYEMALANPSAIFSQDPPLPLLSNFTLPEGGVHPGTETTNVIPVRSGGDELRYYVTGLSQEHIDERLKLAGSVVQAFTQSLGTDTLRHTKYDKEEHPEWYAGFGAGGASVMLESRRMHPIDEIQKPLDAEIKADKLRQNKEKGLKPEDIEGAHTLRARIDNDEVTTLLDKYRDQLDPSDKEAPAILPRMLYYKPEDGDAYAFNRAHAEEAFDGNYGKLFAKVVDACVNLHDPVTHLRTSRASIEALEQLRHVEPQRGNHRPFTFEIELTNLNGLNNALDHESANAVIREFSTMVKKEITDAFKLERNSNDAAFYSAGASKVRVLVKDRQMCDLLHAIAAINNGIEEFNSRPISEGSDDKIGDILQPKRVLTNNPENPQIINDRGLGIEFVALETQPDVSAGKHVDLSEKIMERQISTHKPLPLNKVYGAEDNTLCMKGGSGVDGSVDLIMARDIEIGPKQDPSSAAAIQSENLHYRKQLVGEHGHPLDDSGNEIQPTSSEPMVNAHGNPTDSSGNEIPPSTHFSSSIIGVDGKSINEPNSTPSTNRH